MDYTTKTIEKVEHKGNVFTSASVELIEMTLESGDTIYMLFAREFEVDGILSKYNGKWWKTLKGAQRNFDKARYWVDLYNSFDEQK